MGGAWRSVLGSGGFSEVSGSSDGFEITPTKDGITDPLLILSDDEQKNKDIWKTLPFIQTFNKVEADAGAQVLARHPWTRCGNSSCPLIFRLRIGRGSVTAFAFEGLWRWGFQEKEDASYVYGRLITNMLDEVLKSLKKEPLKLTLSSRNIILGRKLTATLSADMGILKTEKPVLEVVGHETGKTIIKMKNSGTKNGFYSAEYTPHETGVYSFTAKINGVSSETEPAFAGVSPDEFRSISMNREFLSGIAKRAGGEFATENNYEKLVRALTDREEFVRTRKSKSLLDFPLIIILITALLTVEWLLRRRGGLT